ncbi:hypothetical protein [Faecalibacter macacae]|uniref:DUF4129 domain-containing protein n=1 Tax=Faecalibacter macacae TaxID=1859289 RepID=A0A3L9MJD6_9FLAO|nr:hypothetical protein [Faecalibacter macacae]RLZ11404.1 hypothetical protein EAH69_04990 [Faecalibacter macacae]
MKYKLIYVVVFLLTTVFANAQDSLKEFENFKEKYNTKEFDYIVEKPKKEVEPQNLDWLDSFFKFLQNIEWTYVLYTFLGLSLLLVLYKLYRNGMIFQFKTENKIGEYDEHFDYIENNLLTINLVDLINKAKNDKDYRLAIRYYHYQNAQNLAQKEYFVWDPKKTNQQLINQIKKEDIRNLFENNTQIFNQVWFGNFELNEENFTTFEANYNYLNQIV